MTSTTDVEQRASEWIIRSEEDNFTDDMRADMERWLNFDPRHRASFLRIREAWRKANRIRNVRPLDGNVDVDVLQPADLQPTDPGQQDDRSAWTFRMASATAIALVAYFIGFVLWIVLTPSNWGSYSTRIGGFDKITLPDGTVIQLNTNSEIQSRMSPDERAVKLIRGEMLVKVAPDAHRPFIVKASGISVRAAPSKAPETAFNVRVRAPNALDVWVTEGNVSVGPSYRFIDAALGRTAYTAVTLAAGDEATIRPEGIHLARVGLDEINRKLSWTAGLLSFHGETLVEVVQEFNRYNRRQLVVVDPRIAGRRLGGAFQANDPDSFVADLEKGFGIHAEEQITTLSSAPIVRLRGAQNPHTD